MNPGEAWSSWHCPLAVLACALLTGCASDRASIEKLLMANRFDDARAAGVAESYRVGCSDVLEVQCRTQPRLSGRYVVSPTGRIAVGDVETIRVEGRTLPEVADIFAAETGQAPADVQVRIAAFRSQYLLLTGQVFGWQRTVPYQGQETVLDLLQRVGGITAAAELGDIYVVRTHLEEGKRPEVFHVDLRAIVLKQDDRTNLRLLPFDQIYIGESRQAQFEKAFPPWLRPVYQFFWGIRPYREQAAPTSTESRWVAGS